MGKMGLIYWELYRSSCVTNLQGRILNLGYIVYTWGKTKNGVKGVVRVVNEGVLLN